MKRVFSLLMLMCMLILSGCGGASEAPETNRDEIPFAEGQLYAVACLGYEEIEELEYYSENYLNGESVATHHFSGGEYYLVIPRFNNMSVRLYENDMETMGKTLVYESGSCEPFVIRCNISDIFPNVTVELGYNGETVEFSPYISLRDGSVQVGERGLDITKG